MIKPIVSYHNLAPTTFLSPITDEVAIMNKDELTRRHNSGSRCVRIFTISAFILAIVGFTRSFGQKTAWWIVACYCALAIAATRRFTDRLDYENVFRHTRIDDLIGGGFALCVIYWLIASFTAWIDQAPVWPATLGLYFMLVLYLIRERYMLRKIRNKYNL